MSLPALRIEGYVIVSADGMLANAERMMPQELKFEGDNKFFSAKIGTARFFADHILSLAETYRTAIVEGSAGVLALDVEQF